jgi:hypothetical protein
MRELCNGGGTVDSTLCLLVSNYMHISSNFHSSCIPESGHKILRHMNKKLLFAVKLQLLGLSLKARNLLNVNPLCTRQEANIIYDEKHND